MRLKNLLVMHKFACSFAEARRLVLSQQVKQGDRVFTSAEEDVDITKDDVVVGKRVIKCLTNYDSS